MMNSAQRSAAALRCGPFLQDVATIYNHIDEKTIEKVFSLDCDAEGNLLLGLEQGLLVFNPRTLQSRQIQLLHSSPVQWIVLDPGNCLWIGTMQNTCHLSTDMTIQTANHVPSGSVSVRIDLKKRLPAFAVTPNQFFDLQDGTTLSFPPEAEGRLVTCLSDDGVVVATQRTLYKYSDSRLNLLEGFPDSAEISCLLPDSLGGLWIGTTTGLLYYTQGVTVKLTGEDGLPILSIRTLARSPSGALWIGTEAGVVCLDQGRWRYYAGRRWLPHDSVHALLIDSEGAAWVGTESGLARIAHKQMTLTRKADHYEQITQARHNRAGYVTDCHLIPPEDTPLFEASDNDGLWTALYLCAESFRFATTAEMEAKSLAQRSLWALLDLVRVTGISGFPARALLRKGERANQSDPGPNWYPSPTFPDVIYKNDTSSDEIDGHYLAWYVYSELVADTREKAEIASVCRAVTDHILDHHYTLVGPTGKRTTWGVWNPEALNDDPKWNAERGLNALEILSHLKVAYHLCGETRYQEAYRKLIEQHHYALNVVYQKVVPPRGEVNHSDDELAACAYYPLLLLETDPDLRSLYLLSLERTQSLLRTEASPFHNVLYGACTGRPCDAEAALRWLQETPLDLRNWTMRNSHRADVVFQAETGRFGERQLSLPLSPREVRVGRWNRNPYVADAGDGGATEEDGTFWLLPYWMGRYHQIFVEGE